MKLAATLSGASIVRRQGFLIGLFCNMKHNEAQLVELNLDKGTHSPVAKNTC